MKITYDPDVDAMYIQLVEGDHQCRTVRLSDEVALDFAEGEVLVGIEVLDASRIVGRGKLPRLAVNNLEIIGAAPRRNGADRAAPRTVARRRKAG